MRLVQSASLIYRGGDKALMPGRNKGGVVSKAVSTKVYGEGRRACGYHGDLQQGGNIPTVPLPVERVGDAILQNIIDRNHKQRSRKTKMNLRDLRERDKHEKKYGLLPNESFVLPDAPIVDEHEEKPGISRP